MTEEKLDEILGISRCARCGQRLEGEVECPSCSQAVDAGSDSIRVYDSAEAVPYLGDDALPSWVYFTSCFLTSPLSLYWIIKNKRLGLPLKFLAASGGFVWLYMLWF
jgi:hypothetical protein